jgi:hypothetical protein
MGTEPLPPGIYPIAVDKYIIYIMSIAFISNTNISHKKVVWDLVKLWILPIYLENVASKVCSVVAFASPNVLVVTPNLDECDE